MTGLNYIPKAVLTITMLNTEPALQPRLPVVTHTADVCSCPVLIWDPVKPIFLSGKQGHRLGIRGSLRCTAGGWRNAVGTASCRALCPATVLTLFPHDTEGELLSTNVSPQIDPDSCFSCLEGL